MTPRFTSLKKVLDLFIGGQEFSPGEISDKLGMGRTIVHRYLKVLVENGKLEKKGKGPNVKYILENDDAIRLRTEATHDEQGMHITGYMYNPDFKTRKLMDEIFYKFSAIGEKQEGFLGFKKWCHYRNMILEDKMENYIKIHKYVESQFDMCGMLRADEAFGKNFEKKYLDKVLYADQYKYMDFGRGKLAEMTFYAKTSQNKELIMESLSLILPKLECIISLEKFDAIAITPWSIERKNQLLGALKKELNIFNLPFINIIKYYESGIAIPQKSLKRPEDRIQNAKNTIFVDDKNIGKYKKVLLIDDFVGSGATLNETAKKLKAEGVEQVYGFAFVGNTNLSYDVINEI